MKETKNIKQIVSRLIKKSELFVEQTLDEIFHIVCPAGSTS